MNTNFKTLNTKINELIKYVLNVKFELQNPNYTDVDFKDDINTDYFIHKMTSDVYADFLAHPSYRKINLSYPSTSSIH